MSAAGKRPDEAVLSRLQAALDGVRISTDPADLQQYGIDWSSGYAPSPAAVVFPRGIEDVVGLVRFAGENRVPLVPSGGRTGLSGGAVAESGEVIVSFELMNGILDLNRHDRILTVQAGCVTETIQNHAREHGLMFPVDLAARGSCQIGGNIATNAGGIKVIRYGMTRDWVAGLKVVTGKGDVLDLNRGLTKNASGYDLRHLFIGSEGTLGFIVEAMLRLTRPTGPRQVILLAMSDLRAVIEVMLRMRERIELLAYEFFSESALECVVAECALARPLQTIAPYYVLIEFEAEPALNLEAAMQIFEECSEHGLIEDGVVATSEQQARQLWRLREDITEASVKYDPYKNDVSVLIKHIPDFLAEIEQVVSAHYPDYVTVWFGHIGDGNIHLNVLKPPHLALQEFEAQCEEVNRLVFEVVRKYGGSISAEHGVGLLKRPYLNYTRSDQEIAAMRAVKAIFDPRGIMNPGKLLA